MRISTDGTLRTDRRFAGQSKALVADKEETRIRAAEERAKTKRAAQRSAKVVHDDLWLGQRKGIVGVENGVLVIFEETAVVVNGPGLGDRGDIGDAGEFGIVVGLADANLFDRIERRKHFVDGAGIFDPHAGDAVDGDAEQRGGGAQHREVAGIVGLHASFRGECGNGAGGTRRARVDGNGKLDELVADLCLRKIGNVGGDNGRR